MRLRLASKMVDLAAWLCHRATDLAYPVSGRVYIVERYGENR